MVTIRPSGERGHFDFGWLDTRHTFSFGDYHDPRHTRFHGLRVINEDVVAPGRGFDTHPHRDMEILTWIISGALAHKDSTGSEGVIRPGDAQRMTAGSGILHSEFNPSKTEPAHLLQIWIFPDAKGLEPSYEQKHFLEAERRGRLRLIASPEGENGSVTIHADARVYNGLLASGGAASLAIAPGRGAWVQVVRGAITLNDAALEAGDGASTQDESRLDVRATKDSEVLVFDLA